MTLPLILHILFKLKATLHILIQLTLPRPLLSKYIYQSWKGGEMKPFKVIEVLVLGCIIYDFLCSSTVYPGLM